MIYCADGSLFSFGRNDCGQLGHGDVVDKKVPHLIHDAPKDIRSISNGQFHSVVCTKSGVAYVCGKNDYGQLGFENPDNIKSLTALPKITSSSTDMDSNNLHVIQICCGYYHTLLLHQNGTVVGFGRNDYGQLGLGHCHPKVYGLQIVTSFNDKNVKAIYAGCYHSIAVTSNGMLYVCGRNNHGQLATGDTDERHIPHPVDDFVGRQVLSVAAGFYHTIVLVADPVTTSDGEVVDTGITDESKISEMDLSRAGILTDAILCSTPAKNLSISMEVQFSDTGSLSSTLESTLSAMTTDTPSTSMTKPLQASVAKSIAPSVVKRKVRSAGSNLPPAILSDFASLFAHFENRNLASGQDVIDEKIRDVESNSNKTDRLYKPIG
jgi:hypothetical protein